MSIESAVEAIKARYPVEHKGLFPRHGNVRRLCGNTGRPREVDINREEAIRSGKKLFDGKPCKVCGETVRYVSNRACMRCVLDHNRKKRAAK